MKLFKSILISLVLLSGFIFTGCQKSKQTQQICLSDGWTYSLQNPAEAPDAEFKILKQHLLSDLERLVPGGYGYIWLKKTFTIPESLKNQDLSCYLGRITLADRTYLNGQLIGTEGSFPPHEFSAWNTARFYEISEKLLNLQGENDLLIQIFVNGEGSIVSNPFIGIHEQAKKAYEVERFWNSRLNACFAFLMLIISFYHLIIWFKVREEKSALWFCVINVATGLYMTVFFIPEIPWLPIKFISFLNFQKIFSSAMPFTLPFIITSFVNECLHRKEKRIPLIIRWCLFIIPVLIILFQPDYAHLRNLRNWTQPLLLIPFAYIVFILSNAVYHKEKDSLTLLLGFSPMLLTTVLDVLLHDGLKLYNLPYLSSYGWQLVVIALLFVLAARFSAARQEAQDLSEHLQEKVKERTQELQDANDKLNKINSDLENAKAIADKDMKMAVYVQQSFFPRTAPVTSDWDIAYTFNPMSGVSGDLYDFYTSEDKLKGVALFDVSGHGIASGLVTMLAKNVISRKFTSDMNVPLSTVIKDINDTIVEEKGNVENYMTGVLMRMDGCTVQYINAGHPSIFYKTAKGKCVPVQVDSVDQSNTGGIIGIPGLDVEFKSIKFNINSGDSLIIYSDCLSESRNSEGDEYTQDRILKSFSESGNSSAKSKLEYVLSDFKKFTEGVPLKDDLTVIVVQKK